jgi:hypothetical protein
VGVEVLRLAANGTYLEGQTSGDGLWKFEDFYPGTVTLLTAAIGWSGSMQVMEESEWPDPLRLVMDPLPAGGSIIIRRGSGTVPPLSGRLNPIRDSLGRTYIYGDNISFADSPDQPFAFKEGKPFRAEDASEAVVDLTVVVTLGKTSLIRYRLLARSPLMES